jgi:hypothetical protein
MTVAILIQKLAVSGQWLVVRKKNRFVSVGHCLLRLLFLQEHAAGCLEFFAFGGVDLGIGKIQLFESLHDRC